MPRDSSTYGHSSPRRRRRAVVNDKAHSSSSRTYSEKLNSVLASTGGSIVRSEKAHSSSSRTFSEVVDWLLESTGGSIVRSEKAHSSSSRTFSEVVDSLLESTGGSILRSEKPVSHRHTVSLLLASQVSNSTSNRLASTGGISSYNYERRVSSAIRSEIAYSISQYVSNQQLLDLMIRSVESRNYSLYATRPSQRYY
ncbi:hypothetical protein AAZX31_03G050800 [Glycine max]|nr:hypothetical protein JHK86_006455 [Glycine max]KAH1256657.1 hypothetical protein GmHk_03G006767 [Glycine max]